MTISNADLEAVARLMTSAFQSDYALRGDEAKSVKFQIAHMHEEVSEVFKAWREGDFASREVEDKFGLNHPEGLASECADVILVGLGMAKLIEDRYGVDVVAAVLQKHNYVTAKAIAKQVESSKPVVRV